MDIEFGELAGDPDLLDAESAHYSEVAAKIDAAVATLRKLTGLDGMRGEAISALSRTAEDVAGQIATPKQRYLETGEALAAYSPRLRQAQQDARAAAAHLAELGQSAETTASVSAQAAKKLLLGAATMNPDDLLQAKTDAARAAHAAEAAAGELAAWRQQWQAAQQAKAEAAAAASARIVNVIASGGAKMRDGFMDFVHGAWETVKKDASDFGTSVKDVLVSSGFNTALKWMDRISAGLGIAALCLCWVPGLGEILGAADGIAALLDSGAHVAQDAAEGEGGKAAGDAALGLAGVFGGGVLRVVAKNIGRAAKVAKVGNVLGDSGELSSTAATAFEETDATVRLGSAQSMTSTVVAKVRAFAPTWADVKDVVIDGGKDALSGGSGWLRNGYKDFRAAQKTGIFTTGESANIGLTSATEDFFGLDEGAIREVAGAGAQSIGTSWKVAVGVVQTGNIGVKLAEHREAFSDSMHELTGGE